MNVPEIKMVPIDKIDANPYRNLPSYPIIRSKVDSLKMSFTTAGVWPSIVVRPKGDRYEQAFGHQRKAAAKELGIKEVPVIVADLTDEQMVQYMGRENGEDYSADFLIMLNTWEAGLEFRAQRAKNVKVIDVARLLGWTRPDEGHDDRINDVATACAGAHALIDEGHLSRNDLDGLSVRTARDIVTRALSRIDSINQRAKLSGASASDVKHAKSIVGKGVKATVVEARKGTVPSSQIASRVDINMLAAAGKEKGKRTPFFDAFGRALVESIAKVLDRDAIADKLAEIAKVIHQVTDEGDKVVLRQLDFQLGEVADRAQRWRKRLSADKVKPILAQIGGPR